MIRLKYVWIRFNIVYNFKLNMFELGLDCVWVKFGII